LVVALKVSVWFAFGKDAWGLRIFDILFEDLSNASSEWVARTMRNLFDFSSGSFQSFRGVFDFPKVIFIKRGDASL